MVFLLKVYSFLILGIYITIRLLKRLKNTVEVITILIALIFNGLNFYIIYDQMTLSPQTISGNGNPHIPFIFISFLLFLLLCIAISKKIYDLLIHKKALVSWLLIAISCFLGYFSIQYQLEFVSSVREELYYQ